jgi:transcriptional/translational regulatory protein YebC/TACO1
MFARVGEIIYAATAGTADAVMEAAIEAGAEDVTSDEDGHTITCAFEDIGEVSKALEASLGESETVKIVWKAQTGAPVDADRAESVMRLINVLEEDDDVQNVFANFEMDEATMAKLSAA